ncbi:ABC transporter permease [Candidatus Allofournierella excrementavium]|uniref:ABC transporter permease n=2 Tax=Candidatus Allofournierella excrementavium TaxID=2838591 RepID=UPI003AB157A0
MLKNKSLAFPYLIWMTVFIAVPLLIVVYFAFTTKSGAFTLENITALGDYTTVFARSLLLAAIATVICLVLAFPVGYWLSRLPVSSQRMMQMLVILPMWMNFLLRTYAWMSLLENNGLINRFLGLFGIGPFEMINTQGAVVLGMVYNYLPYMILPLYTAMVKIDNSIIEAAQDLGADIFRVLGRVLIPLAMPGIATGITMVFVPSVSTFIISRMLGGGDTMLVGDLIELQFLGNSYNYNLGSAMSLVLMVIVLLCMSLTNTSGNKDGVEGVM